MRGRSYGGVTATGIGLPTLLTVAFVVLKLLGVIDWSWWWVISPIWICVAMGILALIVFVVVYLYVRRKI